jgi:Fe-S-cluster containining protein
MFPLTATQQEEARAAIVAAAGRAEVRAVVNEVYRDLQKEIDARRPVCVISGRCCRFEEFGHQLYVTTLEMGVFLHELRAANPAVAADEKWSGQGCPFQVNKLCSVHAIRPFGCRLFFCDSTSTEWQHEQYRNFHSRLKSLHDQLEVPYFYLEWRQALSLALNLSARP